MFGTLGIGWPCDLQAAAHINFCAVSRYLCVELGGRYSNTAKNKKPTEDPGHHIH